MKHNEELSANRNYKDTIFGWLFSDKEKEEKKLRKAEYEHGLEAGRQEGITIGKEAGIRAFIQDKQEDSVAPECGQASTNVK